MKFIDIGEKGKLNKEISKDKIFNVDSEFYDDVVSVIWSGVIKPGIMDVQPTVTEVKRYEEIQFFDIELNSRDYLHDIARAFYSAIKYPCVVEFHIDDATILGTCEFKPGKLDDSNNTNKIIYFSHFLHEEILSPKAEYMINAINEQVNDPNGSIGDIYNKICEAVMNYSLSGTSKSHVERLIREMVRKGSIVISSVMKGCPIYECYHVISGNKFTGKRNSQKSCIYDYEEIWYYFMKNPKLKEVIEYKRYRDIEDLIYSIDSKSW